MPSSLRSLIHKVTGTPSKKTTKKRATRKTAKRSTKKATKKSAAKKKTKKSVKKTAKKTVKKAKKPTAKRTRKTARPSKKTAKRTTKRVAKSTKKRAAKKATKKSAAKKKTKKSVKKTAKKTVKKAKKPTAKQATKKTTKKRIAKKPAKPRVNWAKKELHSLHGTDPRTLPWDPYRSKIRAAIENGLPESYFSVRRVLYIGASHGYTVSHIAEKPVELITVEKSPEMMRHFLPLAEDMPHVLPILGDAAYPDSYAHYMQEKVDVVFQDIAQRDQVGIFLANCDRFLSRQGVGILSLKAAAVNSTAEPAAVFAEARHRLEEGGATVVQELSLEPYQKQHRLFVIHLNPYFDW